MKNMLYTLESESLFHERGSDDANPAEEMVPDGSENALGDDADEVLLELRLLADVAVMRGCDDAFDVPCRWDHGHAFPRPFFRVRRIPARERIGFHPAPINPGLIQAHANPQFWY